MDNDLFFGKIIDFHTHPYVDESENLCMFKAAFNIPMDEAKEDLQRSGICHICGSVLSDSAYSLSDGFGPLKKLNRDALSLKDRLGGFYTPGFHVHPKFVRESLEEIRYMHERGIKLIGELVPYKHGWKDEGLTYASEEFGEILDLAGQYGMVVSLHTVLEWQEETELMIKRHPDVTFVMAHPGQKADYLKHIERLKKYDNAYLDLSGTGLFRYGMLAYGVENVGCERLIFGTDYPITNPHMYVQAVMYEKISDEHRQKIFIDNSKRLLGLQ